MRASLKLSLGVWLLSLCGLGGLLATPPAQAAPGDLDPQFGDGGLTVHGFGPRPLAGTAADVARQSDGKLIAAGVGDSRRPRIVLARFNPDGSADDSFGFGGTAV